MCSPDAIATQTREGSKVNFCYISSAVIETASEMPDNFEKKLIEHGRVHLLDSRFNYGIVSAVSFTCK